MTQTNYELTLPNPKNLIHALRDIGYSLETALADIIDNSITAKAKNINIYFIFIAYMTIPDTNLFFSIKRRDIKRRMNPITPCCKM